MASLFLLALFSISPKTTHFTGAAYKLNISSIADIPSGVALYELSIMEMPLIPLNIDPLPGGKVKFL